MPDNQAIFQVDRVQGIEKVQSKNEAVERPDGWESTGLIPQANDCLGLIQPLKQKGTDAKERLVKRNMFCWQDQCSKTSHFWKR